jgi:hypothetical protein
MTDINAQVDDEVSTTTQQESTPMVAIVDKSTPKKKYITRTKGATRKQVRTLINQGFSAKHISRVSGVSPQAIYNVKYHMKKTGTLKIKPLQFISTTTGYKLTTPATNEPATPNDKQVGGNHYKDNTIQVWDAIHDWGLDYFSGNVIKYVARHKKKNGVEDLKKGRHYLDKLIAISEKQGKQNGVEDLKKARDYLDKLIAMSEKQGK